MTAVLLFIGLVLGLACAWSKPARPLPQDFSNWGHAMGYAGLACWAVALVQIFFKVA